jgi:hypothetical protein
MTIRIGAGYQLAIALASNKLMRAPAAEQQRIQNMQGRSKTDKL